MPRHALGLGMPPLVKRILINGLITAGILGGLGFLFAELALMWLSGNTPARMVSKEASPPASTSYEFGDSLRLRLPVMLAIYGFGFIAVAELLLYAWRGDPKPKAPPAPREPKLDPAEQLLEQLLAEAEAARKQSPPDAHHPHSENQLSAPPPLDPYPESRSGPSS